MLSPFPLNESLMSFLVAITIQITLLILVVMSGMSMLRPKSAALRHGVWLGTLLAVVVFPGMTYLMRQTRTEVVDLRETARDFGALATWAQPVGTTSAASTSDAAPSANAALPSPPTATAGASIATVTETPDVDDQTRTDLMKIGVFSLWIAGIGLGLFRLNFGWYVARGLKHDSEIVCDERITRPFDAALQLLHVKRPPPLLTSLRVSTPLVVGIMRPAIVLPVGMADELDRAEIQHILIHELAHVIRRDNIVGLLQRIVGIIWWPHPLMHYLNRMLSRAREEVCDNYALLHGDRHLYARTLLHVSQQFRASAPLASTVGLLHSKWKLEQRIAGLLDAGRSLMLKPGRRRSAALILALAFGVIILTGAAVNPPTQQEAIERIEANGGTFQGKDGIEGTHWLFIPPDWKGGNEGLEDAKYVNGIKVFAFNGNQMEEIEIEDMAELEVLHFTNEYNNQKTHKRETVESVPIKKLALKNLPKLTEIRDDFAVRQLPGLQELELVDMAGLSIILIEGLDVGDGLLQSVAGAPNLESVILRSDYSTETKGRTQVTDAGVTHLASLKKLTYLDLRGAQITDQSTAIIGKLSTLEALALPGTAITDEGLIPLHTLKNLKQLYLDETAISNEGLKQIVEDHPQLETLQIAGTRITAAGLEHIRELKKLTSLTLDTRQLNAANCRVIDSLSVTRLSITGHSNEPANIEGLNRIRDLYFKGVSNVSIGPDSLSALKSLHAKAAGANATREIFENLRQSNKLEWLGFSYDTSRDDRNIHVTNELLKHIADCNSLAHFSLFGTHDVTDAGMVHLANLKQLQELSLADANITDGGIQNLSKLENLIVLDLRGTKITNGGLMHFQNLKKLDRLIVLGTNVDENGADRLKVDLPMAKVLLH
ncbi:MAG: M56 family metallopeptidase [Planctomycetaceae bacterium]